MACVGTPTLTQFATITSTGTTTTLSDSISTPPDSISTIVTQSCVLSGVGLDAACVSSVDVTITATIPGVPTTVQVPVILTSPFLEAIPTETLFAPCDGLASPDSSSSSPTSKYAAVSTTPIASVVITQIFTSTQSPTVYTPTPSPDSTAQHHNQDHLGTNAIAIIGGSVGGFVGLICIVGFLWCLIRRRRRWDDIYEDDISTGNTNARFTNVEPKPYQYGLVGYTSTPLAGGELPGSPTYAYGADSHSRQPSIAQPMLPPSMPRPGPSIRTHSSRPSTSGSTQPLQPAQRRPSANEYAVARPSIHHSQPSTSSGGSMSQPVAVASWDPMAEFGYPHDAARLNQAGSPTSIHEPRRQLQIVNASLSPLSQGDPPEASSSAGGSGMAKRVKGGRPQNSKPVIVHTDGGRVDPNKAATDAANQPPAYDD